MRRFLVVANQTANDGRLTKILATLAQQEPLAVTFVVPATPLAQQNRPLGHDEHVVGFGETGAVELARRRLKQAIAALAELDIASEGDVGHPDPLQAVMDALTRQWCDEIIVSTLPRARSRWMAQGLPDELVRLLHVPVTHVEGGSRLLHKLRRGPRIGNLLHRQK